MGGTTVSSTYARTSSTNRLASVSQGGSVVRQFSYDAAGNIVTDAQSGSSNGFTYDGAGQLVSFSQGGSLVASYGFDGLRRRSEVSKTSGGATTVSETIYSGGRRLAANDATGWIDFVDLGDLPLAVFDHGTLSYIHGDRLSAPIQATNGTGALVKDVVLDPFGQTVSATYGTGAALNDTRRFPGQARDSESNLHQNFARTYDPTTGRYVSPDPIGLNGGVNVYAYVLNDPINAIDPLGLATIYGVPPGAVLYSLNGQTFYAPPNANFPTVFNTGTGGGSFIEIGQAVGQGGMFDYQRDSSGNFYPAYTTAANLAVGYYMAGAGYSATATYGIGELYALFNSSNYLSSYFNGGGNENYWSQAVGAANAGVFPTPVSKCGQ